ncbi:hypothetical protein F2Q68_00027067 [Brassica cretica]|uniref:Uncharacterized protein n=1 Tax=Brassica cretica TaxID=69181 RepID=A0A8S9IJF3_BRACR|nr:hypothetical protein F2Q68_00027067 [Brassica cretica]
MIDWYWDPGIQLGLLIRGESQEDEGSGEIVADFSDGGSNMRLRKILGILVLKIDSGVSCVFLVRKVRIKRLSLCCQADEGSSRHRGARWETTRRQEEDARSRYNQAPRREHTPLRRSGEDSREEGEFRRSGNVKEVPSQVVTQPAGAGLEQMTVPVSESAKITTNTTGVENGLDLVDEMLADGLHTLDQFGSNEGLEWAGEEEEPGDEELHEDGLDALMASMEQPLTITDSEAKETITGDGTIQIEGNGHQSNERGTEEVQVETKTGTRKPAGLPNIGINTKKFGQVLLSPRKRAVLKHGNRKGTGTKQPEEKGSLHPKQLMKN